MNKSIAIELYGTGCAVALALGISPQAVSQWPELVPKGAALELEKLTNGALKCDLDLYKGRQRKNKRSSTKESCHVTGRIYQKAHR